MTSSLIQQLVQRHEQVLRDILHQTEIPALRIKEAIEYALFPGGKRCRPMLVYLCGKLIQVPRTILDVIAASIEFTHAYSLIHDDLPAMDNDDMRRGKPSCHRAFDEATAILAGDALQIMAIDVLLTKLPPLLTMSKVIEVTQALMLASGPSGMISGQSLDFSELCKPDVSLSQLETIHNLKTGQLISACIDMVLSAGAPNQQQKQALQQFARHLGFVFQIQDDYMDAYLCSGKGRSSDKINQKITFATHYTQSQLMDMINELYQKTQFELDPFGASARDLLTFINQLHQRTPYNKSTTIA